MRDLDSYLAVDEFSPKTDIVVLIIELANSTDWDISPIKRTNFPCGSREILETVNWS